MSFSESLLPEFDQEIAGTRKTLERVPEDKFSWKPHEKSGTMIWLAGHLASIPGWMVETIEKDGLDMAPNGVQIQPPPPPKTRKELLELFDNSVPKARAALAKASDAHLLKPWSLLNNGAAILTMPRIACIRTWVMNHMIHHRAQLGVYLRLNNIPVPAIYGPSADEGSM
ncbi:MAG: DinB family protein [Candidatus Acidiferrales bacterium]